MHETRRSDPVFLDLNILPEALEVIQIGLQLVFPFPFAHRSCDYSVPVRPQGVDHVLQPPAFRFILDSPGNTYMIQRRHVDEISSRQGHMGCEPRALAADRFFRHLHQDFLAFFENIFNIIGVFSFEQSSPKLRQIIVLGFILLLDEVFHFRECVQNIRHV